jgi:hypothetical protein
MTIESIAYFFENNSILDWPLILIWAVIPLFFYKRIHKLAFYELYPIGLEKEIRKGQTWIYIPSSWEMQRTWLKLKFLAHRVLFAGSIGLMFAIPSHDLILSGISLVFEQFLFFVAGFFVSYTAITIRCKKWYFLRFLDQEISYFGLYSSIKAKYYRNGKQVSETEVKNLCNWEYQSQLRQADRDGVLLEELQSRAIAKEILFRV